MKNIGKHVFSIKRRQSSLSKELIQLSVFCHTRKVSLNLLANELGDHSNFLLILFLNFPFLLPIPLPGLSVIFGFCIALTGLRIVLNRPPWFPQKYASVEFSSQVLSQAFKLAGKVMRKIEIFIHPRWFHFTRPKKMRILNALMISFCGLLLAAPLPPGTNFPPASVILLLTIGMLVEDGVFILFGYFAFLCNLVFFIALGIFGHQGLKNLFSFLS